MRAKTVLGSALQIKLGNAKRLSWRKVLKVFSGELSLTLPPSISLHEYCSSCSAQAKLNTPSEPNWGLGSLTALLTRKGFLFCSPSSAYSPVSRPSLFLYLVSLLSLFFTTFSTNFQLNFPHPTYLLSSGSLVPSLLSAISCV